MAFGIDKLATQIAEMVEAEIRSSFDGSARSIDSPIERLFLAAILGLCAHVPKYEQLGLGGCDRVPDAADFNHRGYLLLGRQVRVLDWPADFLLSVQRIEDGAVFRVVVECDGHEFHERTKEQAARDRSRDRALQARGCVVMRFTGSEVYRDPVRCACEALDWCLARMTEVPTT
ncbi:endonuclease domain-containing protein [Methylobacterium nodulans]|uniref:DUF559 domain-containing protein n=1 Tax=Methylobacterium nodulans (strain LMG 21967 / CNCM I-2342 / ORS 2060) TaxID=460265 RepID=B8INV5_METNO|nr:DUF559 domain-containing protein [Methylobacterium nodulans]ACL58471.1 hypothetical protein Mnod_3561 [Methylobacterium nodulans ORS 2060]